MLRRSQGTTQKEKKGRGGESTHTRSDTSFFPAVSCGQADPSHLPVLSRMSKDNVAEKQVLLVACSCSCALTRSLFRVVVTNRTELTLLEEKNCLAHHQTDVSLGPISVLYHPFVAFLLTTQTRRVPHIVSSTKTKQQRKQTHHACLHPTVVCYRNPRGSQTMVCWSIPSMIHKSKQKKPLFFPSFSLFFCAPLPLLRSP